MRNRWTGPLTLIVLTLAAMPALAGADQVAGKLVCVFPLVNLTAGAKQADYQKPFSDAVELEFQAVGFTIVSRDTWAPLAAKVPVKPEEIREGPQAVQVSRQSGADMAVAGFYRIDADRVLVSVQCYDAAAGTLITGFSHTWRLNLGFYNFLHAEIADLVQKVVFSTAPPLITLKDTVRVDQITFTSQQEGVEVVVEGAESAGKIQGGKVTFNTGGIIAGTPLRIEKRGDGYHTVWQTVRAMPQISLDPVPRANILSVELDWTAGELEGAGAGLRWYPIPDEFFVGLSEYLSTQVPSVPGATWPIHADTGLTLGLYLFGRPESAFRFGIGAGTGVFLTGIPGTSLPLFTDFYIDLFNMWLEYRVGDLKVLTRVDLKLPLAVGNYLLGQNNGPVTWNGIPPITIGVAIPWL
jgi:TolB-like protein